MFANTFSQNLKPATLAKEKLKRQVPEDDHGHDHGPIQGIRSCSSSVNLTINDLKTPQIIPENSVVTTVLTPKESLNVDT